MGDQSNSRPSKGCRPGTARTRLGAPPNPELQDYGTSSNFPGSIPMQRERMALSDVSRLSLKLRKAIATIPEEDLYTQWWR